ARGTTVGRIAPPVRTARDFARYAVARSRIARNLRVPFFRRMKTHYLEVAERIGARLCRNALWSRGRCNWTADRAEGRTTIHASLGPLLYDGTAGIALCLWRLAEVTGERIFRLTPEAAPRHAPPKLPVDGSGLYAGAPGILFAASQMGRKIEETQALAAAALRPEMLDLIGGSAGAIIALLCLPPAGGNAPLLQTARPH